MSDSETEVEIPEPKVLTKPRPKKVMTPEQLEKLAAARVKAAKVKVLLKEERIEKERLMKDEIRAQKLVKTKQKLENQVDTEILVAANKKAAETKKEVATADESDELVEKVEKVKVTKKKKPKKPVVIVDESNSDSSDSDDNSNII